VETKNNCTTGKEPEDLPPLGHDCESCECDAVVEGDGYKGGINSGSRVCSGTEPTGVIDCDNPFRFGGFAWSMSCATGRVIYDSNDNPIGYEVFPPETTPWTRVNYGFQILGPLSPGVFEVDAFYAETYFPGPQPACPTYPFNSDFPETRRTSANYEACAVDGFGNGLIEMVPVYG
jgi:hypothetical protein